MFDSVCIFESVLGLLIAVAGWTDVSYHDSETVATESIFQESGEFAVSVVDILPSTAEGVDTVGQSQERAIDVSPFFHP